MYEKSVKIFFAVYLALVTGVSIFGNFVFEIFKNA